MKKYGQKGITILALVVTIIILLILAGITLSTVTSDSGILGRAKNAANIYRDSAKKENVVLNNYQNAIASAINDVKKPKIDGTKSYVGYYADINDDGKVEGIIYADMATDMKGNGTWGNSSYTIPRKTNLRNYYIENQSYTGNFGTAPVVAPNGSGENRFYVMALKDIDDKQNGTFLGWYNGAYSNGINEYAKITSTGFETGKQIHKQ